MDALLALASASVVRPLYAALKAVPCCHVAGWVAETWVALTAGGWLLLGGAQAAMALLGRLDGLPGSSCCACRPLLLARLEGQVGEGAMGQGRGGGGTVHGMGQACDSEPTGAER